MKHLLLFAATSACFATSALADDARPQTLPGVEGGHSIVKPAPEPEDLPVNEDGSIQIGKTRVKISGSVTVDIGVGAAKDPR